MLVPPMLILRVGGRRVVSRKKKNFYKDPNQNENFIGVKIENDIYYRGEKHY